MSKYLLIIPVAVAAGLAVLYQFDKPLYAKVKAKAQAEWVMIKSRLPKSVAPNPLPSSPPPQGVFVSSSVPPPIVTSLPPAVVNQIQQSQPKAYNAIALQSYQLQLSQAQSKLATLQAVKPQTASTQIQIINTLNTMKALLAAINTAQKGLSS